MSHRPITDIWYCVRPKLRGGVKYYGAYPAGFLERARALLGCRLDEPVLHVCGGFAHLYPYYGGYGPYDARMDLNRMTRPEYAADVRDAKAYPKSVQQLIPRRKSEVLSVVEPVQTPWAAMLADPPYSAPEATHYPPGAAMYPTPRLLLANMLKTIEPGRRVGILCYASPRPPADIPVRFVAKVTIAMPYDNHDRTYSVYEKLDVQGVRRSKLILPKTSLFGE